MPVILLGVSSVLILLPAVPGSTTTGTATNINGIDVPGYGDGSNGDDDNVLFNHCDISDSKDGENGFLGRGKVQSLTTTRKSTHLIMILTYVEHVGRIK